MDASYLSHCKNVLRQNGYVVIARERHRVITARFVVPPHEVEYSRLSAERYADMVHSSNLQRLIRQADADGLIIHERKDINDPITGREVVFSSAMGLIKPKE